MTADIAVSPEMERFAAALVAPGRYAGLGAVADDALRDMRARVRAGFVAMLEEAARGSDAKGWVDLDDALAQMDGAVAEAERKRGAACRLARVDRLGQGDPFARRNARHRPRGRLREAVERAARKPGR